MISHNLAMNFAEQREMMIKQQLRTVGVLDDKVLQLFRDIPRHKFVPEAYQSLAYADYAIPLGYDQFMLPPKEEAQILQALAIKPTDKVLEVGTGSGFMTALLAEVAHEIKTVDIFPEFLEAAKKHLHEKAHIAWHCEDLSLGVKEKEAYDVIVITGALASLPESFKQALRPGGRLFVVTGKSPAMTAYLITRNGNSFQTRSLYETVVPYLINAPLPSKFTF